MQYLKIPRERAGILIGKGGKVKNELEGRTESKIEVNDGEITIEGEPIEELKVVEVVKAIGRGFSPEHAFKLLSGENTLKIISLREFCNTEKALRRKKGRVIGKGGKARRVIEDLTNTRLSVYGKTVAIIGGYDGVEIASEAILKILEGMSHSSVYRFLEKNAPQLKKSVL